MDTEEADEDDEGSLLRPSSLARSEAVKDAFCCDSDVRNPSKDDGREEVRIGEGLAEMEKYR